MFFALRGTIFHCVLCKRSSSANTTEPHLQHEQSPARSHCRIVRLPLFPVLCLLIQPLQRHTPLLYHVYHCHSVRSHSHNQRMYIATFVTCATITATTPTQPQAPPAPPPLEPAPKTKKATVKQVTAKPRASTVNEPQVRHHPSIHHVLPLWLTLCVFRVQVTLVLTPVHLAQPSTHH